MRQKIKDFWAKQPKHTLIGPTAIDSWEVHIGDIWVGKVETVCRGNKYRYNDQWYSEDEMLSLINLIVFE